MVERFKNWKTTIAGLGVTAAFIVVFESFHCEFPSDWMVWAISTLPAAFGALSKD